MGYNETRTGVALREHPYKESSTPTAIAVLDVNPQ